MGSYDLSGDKIPLSTSSGSMVPGGGGGTSAGSSGSGGKGRVIITVY